MSNEAVEQPIRPLTVLLVEDRDDDAELTVAELKRAGFDFEWTRVESEQDYITQLDNRHDLILADYHLPQFGALKAIDLLNESGSEMPLIVVSGSMGDEAAAECIIRGAYDYVLKDHLTRLGPTVRSVLERKRLRDRARQAETSLFEREEQLSTLLNSTAESIYGLDLEGRCTFANATCVATLGYENQDGLLGKNMHNLIHHTKADGTPYPEDQCTVCHASNGERGKHSDDEVVWRADGSTLPVEYWSYPTYRNGILTGSVVTLIDVSERKRAESETQRLSEENAKLAEISLVLTSSLEIDEVYDQFGELVRVLIPSDKVDIISTDAEAATLTIEHVYGVEVAAESGKKGHTRSWENSIAKEIVQRGAGAIIDPIDEQDAAARFSYAALTYQYGFRSTIAVPMIVHGETIGMLALLSTKEKAFSEEQLRLAERVSAQVAGVISNARLNSEIVNTNRRLQEALVELKQTQENVVQEERLRALGTMASGIAHDFNNALSPIVGFSDLLLEHPEMLEEKEKARKYLGGINTAAMDAAEVVNRLSKFYKHREDDDAILPVDLNKLVTEAISMTQPRWKDMAQSKGIAIQLQTDLADDLPLVGGSESNLRTALTNLIFNAVDALPDGGRVFIFSRQEGNEVVLGVRDNGIGMSEEVKRRVLEPFFTTKGESGTGLGLAMVYGIVERHNGTLDIESEPDKGATFIVRLPVYTEGVTETKRPSTDEFTRGLRILAAEDEPIMRDLLTEYLVRDGHFVEFARDGREALEMFTNGDFHLVITDRGMPEMSGDQLAAAIKGTTKRTPVIMLSGFGQMMVTSNERPPGVDFILSKPVTLAGLRDALSNVLSR